MNLSLSEMKSYMHMKSFVAIISAAASTGFSLHADKNRHNRRKRTHITVQFAWGPEQIVQQLGYSFHIYI